MSTKTSSTRTEGLLTLFDLHTKFFTRAIEDIKEEDTYNRLNTNANHISWLAGSTVHQRFQMTSEIHPDLKQNRDDLFKNNKGIDENASYPTVSEYIKDWEKISPFAREALITITDEKLDSTIDMGFMKMTYYELISFTMYREASIIGQLALWRRLLNYPALKYD